MRGSFDLSGIRLLIINCLLLMLAGCSVQKQLSRSARETVLDNAAFATAHVGISIYDPATGKYLFNHQGDKYFVPASNTKILTCYAAMKYLGDSLVGIEYQVNPGQSIDIRPTGDPTFLHPDFSSQPVFEFLKKQKEIIFTQNRITQSLGDGWSWNDHMEAYMTPRSQMPIYGNLIQIRWISSDSVSWIPDYFRSKQLYSDKIMPDGFEIIKPIQQNVFTLINGTRKRQSIPFEPTLDVIFRLLGDTLRNINMYHSSESRRFHPFRIIHSQPTDSLLKPMMHRSDNFFAEQSLLMVSNEVLGRMDDEKVIDTILKTDFKDLPQQPRWADGSGLSRYNLFTPQSMVAILGKMKNEFGMDRIKVIFPIGGEGTISSYYRSDSGYFYGKTGTLSGVVAFSGYLYTRKGKLLIFSTLINNHRASATDIRRGIEKFLTGVRSEY